jgi:hypothetical protein
MKKLSALVLALTMMFSGSGFAAGASTVVVAEAHDAPKIQQALCQCGKKPDGTVKWCPCGSSAAEAASGGSISGWTIGYIVAGLGLVAVLASHKGSTGTQ